MPFETHSEEPEGMKYMQNKSNTTENTAKIEDADVNDGTAKNEDADANDNTAMNNDAEDEHKNMTDMAHGKMQVNQSLGSRIGSTFITFFQFFSIMFLFAVITCVVDLLFIVKGHKLHHTM